MEHTRRSCRDAYTDGGSIPPASTIFHRPVKNVTPQPQRAKADTHPIKTHTNRKFVSLYMRQTIWFQVSVFRCQEGLKPDTRNLLRKTEIIPIRSSGWSHSLPLATTAWQAGFFGPKGRRRTFHLRGQAGACPSGCQLNELARSLLNKRVFPRARLIPSDSPTVAHVGFVNTVEVDARVFRIHHIHPIAL